MPVDMWHHIAQAGEIDLVWLQQFTQNGFRRTDGAHECRSMLNRQVRHLSSVRIEDHAAKTGPRRIIDGDYPI